jgi:hypothetical protein
MTDIDFEAALSDFAAVHHERPDAELSLIEAALFMEECFGFSIGDDEIVKENLGDAAAMRRFAAAKVVR